MGAAARQPLSPAPTTSVRDQARSRYRELEAWLREEGTLELPLHSVEIEQERRGREIQRLLLQDHLDRRGDGDVGRAVEVVGATPRVHSQRRQHTRKVISIFGALVAQRLAYYAPEGGSVHPLDEAASLPRRVFGYELQRRLVLGALQGPFDEALERAVESTGVRLSKRSAEDVVRDAATDFDEFYAQRARPNPKGTGPILVVSLDGKGVPMVKPENALRVVRRRVGTKANKKRMATVAAVFTQKPVRRTAESVIENLFYEGPWIERPEQRKRPEVEHKRVWASVEKERVDVFAQVVEEAKARDPDEKKTLVLLVDGERGLQCGLAECLPRGIEVLDLMHVMERLWRAAFCFHHERSPEARQWVRHRALQLLQGRVSQVIKGMGQSATKRRLRAAQRLAVDDAIRYFRRNRHRMRYDDYLRRGLPIASGAVEGACKNLIKDRMERSGMRWTIPGAESMLQIRATYLSGDLDDYWAFHVRREQERIYPAGRWRALDAG